VRLVRYPGLGDGPHAHAQAALARRQMAGGGGMVSFIPSPSGGRTARERAVTICESVRVFTLAESLGGVESLIELPAVMTHASVAGSPLEVDDALIRLSVGVESVADLVEDLRQALEAG
jgi:cystathionine gamma-synthase